MFASLKCSSLLVQKKVLLGVERLREVHLSFPNDSTQSDQLLGGLEDGHFKNFLNIKCFPDWEPGIFYSIFIYFLSLYH